MSIISEFQVDKLLRKKYIVRFLRRFLDKVKSNTDKKRTGERFSDFLLLRSRLQVFDS